MLRGQRGGGLTNTHCSTLLRRTSSSWSWSASYSSSTTTFSPRVVNSTLFLNHAIFLINIIRPARHGSRPLLITRTRKFNSGQQRKRPDGKVQYIVKSVVERLKGTNQKYSVGGGVGPMPAGRRPYSCPPIFAAAAHLLPARRPHIASNAQLSIQSRPAAAASSQQTRQLSPFLATVSVGRSELSAGSGWAPARRLDRLSPSGSLPLLLQRLCFELTAGVQRCVWVGHVWRSQRTHAQTHRDTSHRDRRTDRAGPTNWHTAQT